MDLERIYTTLKITIINIYPTKQTLIPQSVIGATMFNNLSFGSILLFSLET